MWLVEKQGQTSFKKGDRPCLQTQKTCKKNRDRPCYRPCEKTGTDLVLYTAVLNQKLIFELIKYV